MTFQELTYGVVSLLLNVSVEILPMTRYNCECGIDESFEVLFAERIKESEPCIKRLIAELLIFYG